MVGRLGKERNAKGLYSATCTDTLTSNSWSRILKNEKRQLFQVKYTYSYWQALKVMILLNTSYRINQYYHCV